MGLELIEKADEDRSGKVTEVEFVNLLSDMETVDFLASVDIDAVALVDLADLFFKSKSTYEYHEIIGILLDLRGSRGTTMKDLADFRSWMDRQLVEVRKEINGEGGEDPVEPDSPC